MISIYYFVYTRIHVVQKRVIGSPQKLANDLNEVISIRREPRNNEP
jgi:hypothetical protein